MSEQFDPEVFNTLLAVTREQLSKSMNLNAELEALLLSERKKTAELEARLAEVSTTEEEKK